MADQFDPNSSFTDEITSTKEAEQAVKYLSRNEVGWRGNMASEGKDYDEIQEEVRQVWLNIIHSCKRVGYSDYHVRMKAKEYKVNL